MEMSEIVKSILVKVLECEVAPNQHSNLFDQGLDSLKVMQLIVMLEQETGISFLDDDLLFENFETIDKILNTMKRAKSKVKQ